LEKRFNQFLIWENLLEEMLEEPLEEETFHMKQPAMQELRPNQRPTHSAGDLPN
jgi:hypothetical protein